MTVDHTFPVFTSTIIKCWHDSVQQVCEYYNFTAQTFFVNGNVNFDEEHIYLYIAKQCSAIYLNIAVEFYSIFITLLRDNNILYGVYLINPYENAE